ncbi:MAG: hypothetical protein JSU61_14000 [Fidelibacterota bacterium]|nr:MAG: hypothetical protein JSU61_14000 [Candidatus Neomarinimicrobiota bacterium]
MTLYHPNLTRMIRLYFILILALIFSACATHPTMSPVPLKAGESYWGYTLSTENVLPFVFMRRGLTDHWDLGLRVGMPIYGSGVDISRLLVDKNNRSDVLNLAYSFNPNHNVDLTYYRVKRKLKVNEEKNTAVQRLRYWGLRGMLITSGISGRQSARFGILFGGAPALKGQPDNLPRFYRFQWEIGYFHDFDSMPIRALFSPLPFDEDHELWDERFAEYPHTTKGNLPSEHSRLTGISLRVSFPLGRPSSGDADKGETP